MDTKELRGLFKGLGIGIIVCTAIFYMMVINLRVDYEDAIKDDDRIILAATELGMVFPTEGMMPTEMSEDEIIEAARDLGMIFLDTVEE